MEEHDYWAVPKMGRKLLTEAVKLANEILGEDREPALSSFIQFVVELPKHEFYSALQSEIESGMTQHISDVYRDPHKNEDLLVRITRLQDPLMSFEPGRALVEAGHTQTKYYLASGILFFSAVMIHLEKQMDNTDDAEARDKHLTDLDELLFQVQSLFEGLKGYDFASSYMGQVASKLTGAAKGGSGRAIKYDGLKGYVSEHSDKYQDCSAAQAARRLYRDMPSDLKLNGDGIPILEAPEDTIAAWIRKDRKKITKY